MAKHERFHIRTFNDLDYECRRLDISIPYQDDTSILFDSVPIRRETGSHSTINRFAVHPMEGFDADESGTPQDLTFRRYGRYAAGGTGTIWFEATAVTPEGRSNPHQLHINTNNVNTYKQLVSSTRDKAHQEYGPNHNLVLILQLTHSGRYSKPYGKPEPIIAHRSPILDHLHSLPDDYPLVTDEYLDKLQGMFVDAAKLAAAAGFDGVDIKSCHRYLLSELLASHTRENSKYGGSFENRTRMLVETFRRIKNEVPEVFVTTRMNVFDAKPYPYGFGVSQKDRHIPDLSEPIRLVGLLKEIDLPILNLSIGNPYYEPHFGRPFDFPSAGVAVPETHPLESVARFIDISRQIQQAHTDVPVIGSGYSWLRRFLPNVAAAVVSKGWATMIGQGRNSFAYPDSVKDLKGKGAFDPEKVCITCSACTQIMRDGGRTGCVVRDSDFYGPEYRKYRRMAADMVRNEANRCRNCENPTCRGGCPAGIDIPGFIKAFADNDIEKAYAILRKKNSFPELCAYICPTEVQCEGSCVENTFSGNPIPIHEIQRYVAKEARARGLAAVALGESTGKRIAVLGAGPAGLACCAGLLERGHTVELFDPSEDPGGTPGEAIPTHRLSRQTALEEIWAILDEAKKEKRLIIHAEKGLSTKLPLSSFLENFAAVFVGIGLGEETPLPKSKRNLEGVVSAMTFLRTAKTQRIPAMPESVCVLGGGNTALDAAVTAKENGALDVSVIYRRSFSEMPAWPNERNKALASGIQFLILTQPLDYIVEGGKLVGLKVARTILGDADESGRRKAVVLENSEAVLPTQLVIEALGQRPSTKLRQLLSGVELDRSGLIDVDPQTMQTSNKKIFAGGDVVNGGTTAVQAIADGMLAAEHIDAFVVSGDAKAVKSIPVE